MGGSQQGKGGKDLRGEGGQGDNSKRTQIRKQACHVGGLSRRRKNIMTLTQYIDDHIWRARCVSQLQWASTASQVVCQKCLFDGKLISLSHLSASVKYSPMTLCMKSAAWKEVISERETQSSPRRPICCCLFLLVRAQQGMGNGMTPR